VSTITCNEAMKGNATTNK